MDEYPFDAAWAAEAVKDSDDRVNARADDLIASGELEAARELLDHWYN